MTRLRLPMLEARRSELEKCVYCPKLCRDACPVSNVEASETVTPWSKMSMAYFAARGDVPTSEAVGALAWACTGCMACRERCDHKTNVADVLRTARMELLARGAAPEPARRVATGYASHAERTRELSAKTLGPHASSDPDAQGVLVGCGYLQHAPEVGQSAMKVLRAFGHDHVRPIGACCGRPLLEAGDRVGFAAAARAFLAEAGDVSEVTVVDPSCASAIANHYEEALGPAEERPVPRVRLLVDTVFERRHQLEMRPIDGAVRYHDPCHLARGWGRVEQPRAILERVLGRPVDEFARNGAAAECSGGGGLLPLTRPRSSASMADARLEQHRARGGGLLVTACANSLRRFRSRGQRAIDLVELVADAVPTELG